MPNSVITSDCEVEEEDCEIEEEDCGDDMSIGQFNLLPPIDIAAARLAAARINGEDAEEDAVLRAFIKAPKFADLATRSKAAASTQAKDKSQLKTSYQMFEDVLDNGTYAGYRKSKDGGKCNADSLRQRISSLARTVRGEHHRVKISENDIAPILPMSGHAATAPPAYGGPPPTPGPGSWPMSGHAAAAPPAVITSDCEVEEEDCEIEEEDCGDDMSIGQFNLLPPIDIAAARLAAARINGEDAEEDAVLRAFIKAPKFADLATRSKAAASTQAKDKSQLKTSYQMFEDVLDNGTYAGYRKSKDGGKCNADSLRQRISSLARTVRGEHHRVKISENDIAPILPMSGHAATAPPAYGGPPPTPGPGSWPMSGHAAAAPPAVITSDCEVEEEDCEIEEEDCGDDMSIGQFNLLPPIDIAAARLAAARINGEDAEEDAVLRAFIKAPKFADLATRSKAAASTQAKDKSQLKTSYQMFEDVLDNGTYAGQ
ncbi:hypothetical protein V8C86DRAFT_3118137 [Haematococcus lacustris]